VEFWRTVLRLVLLTPTGLGEHWDQGRAGQRRGWVLNAAVMTDNKARVSHIQIWKWTLYLLPHSLAPFTVLCGPWPLELQTPTLLYLIAAFSALFSPHPCLPKILFNIFQLSQTWSSHSYPSFRFTLKYLLNYTVTTCNIHSNFSFVIYPTISKWYRDPTWVKKNIHIYI